MKRGLLFQVLWYVFLFVWQLPQHLLGAILLLVMYKTGLVTQINYDRTRHRYFIETTIGISLGMFIFWFPTSQKNGKLIKYHEYGHSVQSCMLGPLYLIIIGIPSFLFASYAQYYQKRYHIPYHRYEQIYCEKWATKLGALYEKGESFS